jgi:hypothetical protein
MTRQSGRREGADPVARSASTISAGGIARDLAPEVVDDQVRRPTAGLGQDDAGRPYAGAGEQGADEPRVDARNRCGGPDGG